LIVNSDLLAGSSDEMQVTEAIEGVKVYNLSAGKTLKEWLNEASTRHVSLKKSVRRVANQNPRVAAPLTLIFVARFSVAY